MKVEIFDVGHGHCSVVTAPNGRRVMLDCGFGADSRWYPSVEFAGQFIDLLAVLNLDEDHVDDLPYLMQSATIGAFFSNPTISAAALHRMKRETGGMRAGVAAASAILGQFGRGDVGTIPIDTGDVHICTYYNRFGLDFSDTNNLSLAVFVRYAGVTVLFAGDLEVAGWRRLLARPNFCADLSTVQVVVAAHHGRASGLCDEIFQYCRPEIVVISDKEKMHDTQETHRYFYSRTRGIPLFDSGSKRLTSQRRYVYTTRSDGKITIDVVPQGRYVVTPEYPTPIHFPTYAPAAHLMRSVR